MGVFFLNQDGKTPPNNQGKINNKKKPISETKKFPREILFLLNN